MAKAADRGDSGDQKLEPLIFVVRGQRVMLDADLARLYGVTTKRFNEGFKRNQEDSSNWPQNATSSSAFRAGRMRHRSVSYRPWAFTEHGALMAANVLRSPQAMRMSVFVIRAFVRLREEVNANALILKRLAEIDKTLLQHDAALHALYRKLQTLLVPSPEAPERRIGF
jgi:hypothetical protein